MMLFWKFDFVKDHIWFNLHDSIGTKRKCIWYDHFLSVYSKLDAYMVYRYVFLSLLSLNRWRVRWKPAWIYYGNATKTRATSGTKIAGSKTCEGFSQIYFRINVKWLKCVASIVALTARVSSLKLYTYYISHERLLSEYFGRIPPKTISFLFGVMFPAFGANV